MQMLQAGLMGDAADTTNTDLADDLRPCREESGARFADQRSLIAVSMI
jgi:hypothetical protein